MSSFIVEAFDDDVGDTLLFSLVATTRMWAAVRSREGEDEDTGPVVTTIDDPLDLGANSCGCGSNGGDSTAVMGLGALLFGLRRRRRAAVSAGRR